MSICQNAPPPPPPPKKKKKKKKKKKRENSVILMIFFCQNDDDITVLIFVDSLAKIHYCHGRFFRKHSQKTAIGILYFFYLSTFLPLNQRSK